MSACTCVATWSTTASYGRKLVDTIARPGAWAMAQRTISSGDLSLSPALSWASSAEVMVISGGGGRSGRGSRGGLGGGSGSGDGGRLGQEDARGEIAEALAGEALVAPAGEERLQLGFELHFLDDVLVDLVQARAGDIAAEPELVLAGRFADEADLGHVRAGAAVRAAGGADDDLLVGEAELGGELLDAVDETRQGALGFGEAEAAGRHRGARHRGRVEKGGLVRGLHAVRGEQRVDPGAIGRRPLGEEDVLVAAEAKLQVREFFRNLAQRGLQRVGRDVLDAARLHEEREEVAAVDGALPAVGVGGGGELEAANAREGGVRAAVDLGGHPRDAA